MKTLRPKEREADVQRTILDGLAALRIWHVRMNSGAMVSEYRGKKRMLRFGRKGMADILSFPAVTECRFCDGRYSIRDCPFADHERVKVTLWIEVKRPGEKQTPEQIAFEQEVTAEGHRYICVSSWEQVLEALK